MIYQAILLVLAVTAGISAGQETSLSDKERIHELCPVSSEAKRDPKVYYYYPQEIYSSGLSKLPIPTVPCWSIDDHEGTGIFTENYHCPTVVGSCPVQHFPGLTEDSDKWKKGNDICQLGAHLKDPDETVRVIIFGSSVAKGHLTRGCCNRPECLNYRDDGHSPCSYNKYFATWLGDAHAAKVQWINMAESGYRTDTSLQLMDLKAHGITTFTSRDIIFLDHTHNDELVIKDTPDDMAVEAMFRRLLLNSASMSDLPTIILLETDARDMGVRVYPPAYRKMSEYYGIRLWSMYDAVWRAKPDGTSTEAYKRQWPHLMGDPSVRVVRWHPAWHVHMYMADMFAAALESELSKCPADSATRTPAPYVLPAPLVNTSTSRKCKPNRDPVLYLNYNNVKDTSLPHNGQYEIPAGSAWQVGVDYKSRGGFLISLKDGSTCQENGNSIKFKWGMTVGQGRMTDEILLQMTYQKSYWGAGKAKVYWCGGEIGSLDALWPDYEHYHYTLPNYFVHVLDSRLCHQNPDEQADAVLEIKFEASDCGAADLVTRQPRQHQMFKVNSISACYQNQDLHGISKRGLRGYNHTMFI